MLVEIWSDLVCPWCYIGKRNFETALAGFEHRDEVEVHWRSYELDPSAQAGPIDLASALAAKYNTDRDGALAMMSQVSGVAESVGLHYRFDLAQRSNTFDAHRVIHLAAKVGHADAIEERFMAAYFPEGADLSDHDTLAELATAAGLDPSEVSVVLSSEQFTAEVRADEQHARELGITGVPTFVVNGTRGVSGAQAPERLLQLLQRGWDESASSTE